MTATNYNEKLDEGTQHFPHIDLYTLNSAGHCKVDCQMSDCSWDPPGTIKIHWQSGDMVDGGMHCTGDLVRGNVRRARVLVTAVTLASASANAG